MAKTRNDKAEEYLLTHQNEIDRRVHSFIDYNENFEVVNAEYATFKDIKEALIKKHKIYHISLKKKGDCLISKTVPNIYFKIEILKPDNEKVILIQRQTSNRENDSINLEADEYDNCRVFFKNNKPVEHYICQMIKKFNKTFYLIDYIFTEPMT